MELPLSPQSKFVLRHIPVVGVSDCCQNYFVPMLFGYVRARGMFADSGESACVEINQWALAVCHASGQQSGEQAVLLWHHLNFIKSEDDLGDKGPSSLRGVYIDKFIRYQHAS
jgi:hypothetical protein